MRRDDGGCADSRELEPASTSALATMHMITRILNIGSAMATLIGCGHCPEEGIPLQRAPASHATIIVGTLGRMRIDGPSASYNSRRELDEPTYHGPVFINGPTRRDGLMNERRRAATTLAFAAAAVFALPTLALAQLKVITSGGFATAYREALPEFERTTSITVATTSGASQGSGPNTIGAQLRRGVPADVVILSREGLDELIAEGRIVAATDVNLAQTPLGMAVREGAPKPDISTVDAFKQTLLRAKSIAFANSTTGIYMTTKLFPRLGIAEQVAAKSTTVGVGAVARGDAEIAIQPVSELLHVAGTAFVGTLPRDVQYLSVFAAAVVAGSPQPEAAKRLIAFLASEQATSAIKNSGMEPVHTQQR
jgi:molybdate transport system substrate-binding protein